VKNAGYDGWRIEARGRSAILAEREKEYDFGS
jgi:hypothetical protein